MRIPYDDFSSEIDKTPINRDKNWGNFLLSSHKIHSQSNFTFYEIFY